MLEDEPTTITLLNGHCVNLLSTSVSLTRLLMKRLDLIRGGF